LRDCGGAAIGLQGAFEFAAFGSIVPVDVAVRAAFQGVALAVSVCVAPLDILGLVFCVKSGGSITELENTALFVGKDTGFDVVRREVRAAEIEKNGLENFV
jgi:hypothetical protein